MKKLIIPILAALVLISCSLPITININTPVAPTGAAATPIIEIATTAAPIVATVTPAPVFEGQELNLGGVYMVLPPCLASGASGVIVPEENPGADMPVFAYNPAYRKVTLTGYPLSDKFWEPIIQVYPVARYEELVSTLTDHVAQMQQILNDHPADVQNSIPLLPIENAAQIFHAQMSYINFQNGQGVGFLTEYAQSYDPVNNHDLFYTFQGLTADGSYWISAIFPANAAYLQDSYDSTIVPADGIAAPDMNSASLETDMKTYYAAMVTKLNTTPAESFTPSLSCIKRFIQSINIGN